MCAANCRDSAVAFRATGPHQQDSGRAIRLLVAAQPTRLQAQFTAPEPYARRVPRTASRTAPPRTARFGRSSAITRDPDLGASSPAPPACWPRRGSCTPNAHAARQYATDEATSVVRPGRLRLPAFSPTRGTSSGWRADPQAGCRPHLAGACTPEIRAPASSFPTPPADR